MVISAAVVIMAIGRAAQRLLSRTGGLAGPKQLHLCHPHFSSILGTGPHFSGLLERRLLGLLTSHRERKLPSAHPLTPTPGELEMGKDLLQGWRREWKFCWTRGRLSATAQRVGGFCELHPRCDPQGVGLCNTKIPCGSKSCLACRFTPHLTVHFPLTPDPQPPASPVLGTWQCPAAVQWMVYVMQG